MRMAYTFSRLHRFRSHTTKRFADAAHLPACDVDGALLLRIFGCMEGRVRIGVAVLTKEFQMLAELIVTTPPASAHWKFQLHEVKVILLALPVAGWDCRV